MANPAWKRWYGSAVLAAHLAGQKRRPFLPREKLDAIRDRRIRQTVLYAARHVPFYRDWFDREKLDPRSIGGAADLERLPVLDKEQVRTEPRLFMAGGRFSRTALSFLTSGTTGVPIEIHHDRHSLLANIAYGERERDALSPLCGAAFRPGEVYVGYETSTFKSVTAFYEESLLLPVRPKRRFVPLAEPMDRILAIINEERPDILVGYGGWLDLFFRTVAARGAELFRPKVVMYMGEALPFGARQHIEGELGIPVLSRYNAVESFKIGFYCEQRSGFHLHEDICHVRILDRNGKPVPAGEPGEVVLSNLVNRATVLLNYPMGDVAALSPQPCACGRTFRMISELEGRTEDVLELPHRRSVHPREIWQVFKQEREVLQYQLTQLEPLRFELEIVMLDESAFSGVQHRVLPALNALLGDGVHIQTRWRPDIVRRAGQKFRAVRSMRPPSPM